MTVEKNVNIEQFISIFNYKYHENFISNAIKNFVEMYQRRTPTIQTCLFITYTKPS